MAWSGCVIYSVSKPYYPGHLCTLKKVIPFFALRRKVFVRQYRMLSGNIGRFLALPDKEGTRRPLLVLSFFKILMDS